MDPGELGHRFQYHPPGPRAKEFHENVRTDLEDVAQQWNANLPEGREKSLAVTKLEEAMFWANAAIARTMSD